MCVWMLRYFLPEFYTEQMDILDKKCQFTSHYLFKSYIIVLHASMSSPFLVLFFFITGKFIFITDPGKDVS